MSQGKSSSRTFHPCLLRFGDANFLPGPSMRFPASRESNGQSSISCFVPHGRVHQRTNQVNQFQLHAQEPPPVHSTMVNRLILGDARLRDLRPPPHEVLLDEGFYANPLCSRLTRTKSSSVSCLKPTLSNSSTLVLPMSPKFCHPSRHHLQKCS